MWFADRLRLIRERYPYICMDAETTSPATPRRLADMRRGIVLGMYNGDTIVIYPAEDVKIRSTSRMHEKLEEEEIEKEIEQQEVD